MQPVDQHSATGFDTIACSLVSRTVCHWQEILRWQAGVVVHTHEARRAAAVHHCRGRGNVLHCKAATTLTSLPIWLEVLKHKLTCKRLLVQTGSGWASKAGQAEQGNTCKAVRSSGDAPSGGWGMLGGGGAGSGQLHSVRGNEVSAGGQQGLGCVVLRRHRGCEHGRGDLGVASGGSCSTVCQLHAGQPSSVLSSLACCCPLFGFAPPTL